MSEEAKTTWYQNITSKINQLAEELGLDDFTTGKLRDTMFDIAKEQYKRGNKSGASWAFKQAAEKAATA